MFGQVGIDKLHGFQSMKPLFVNMGQKPVKLIHDACSKLMYVKGNKTVKWAESLW